MPKKLHDALNVRISAEIARHRDGIGIEGLHVALAGLVSRRTLQRRLLDLTREKRLSAAGVGKARRYQALDIADIPIEGTHAVTLERAKSIAVGEIYVPFSTASQEILAHVRLPIQQRTPIGYDRTFLESYRPNKSHYLPQETRDHLRNIGQAPDGERLGD